MNNLHKTITDCIKNSDYTLLDAVLSVSPIDVLSTSVLVSSIAAISTVEDDLPTRDSFYESVLEELESRDVDTIAVRQEIELGYCQ
jgi:hypothetical protein